MRIVQAANFVTPSPGGLRTAVEALASGYTAAGHEPVLVVPGAEDRDEDTPTGRRITLRSPSFGRAGYRMIVDCRRVRRLVEGLRPDRVEVSDRATLRCLGPWARRLGVPAVAVVHERLDALARLRLPGWLPAGAVTERWNRRLAASFDTVVCTTGWAIEEFTRLGVGNTVRVSIGVDLAAFAPARHDPALRDELAAPDELLVATIGRLSPEKRPELAVRAIGALRRRRVPARLVVVGAGPLRARLEREAADLPVTFLGHVDDRDRVASLLATADIALSCGPVETFGLAALEALASGTPIVTARTGALPELLSPEAGVTAYRHPSAVAGAIRTVASWDVASRRRAARRRAEAFPWSRSVTAMLDLHRLAA